MSGTREAVRDVAAPVSRRRWQRSPARRAEAPSPAVISTRHARRDALVRRVLACADAIALVVAIALGAAIGQPEALGDHVAWGLLTLPGFIALFKLYRLYDRDVKRVSHTTVDDLPWVFHALLVGAPLLWLHLATFADRDMVLGEALAFGATAIVSVLVMRSVVRSIAIRRLEPERVLLVGAGEMTQLLVRKMFQHPEYGLNPIGVVCPDGSSQSDLTLPVLGDFEDLRDVVMTQRIDRIVLSRVALEEERQLELLRRCRELSLKVSVLPQLFETLGPSVEIDDIEGITLLGIHPPMLSRSTRFMKRTLDAAGSALLLILLAPLLAAIAIAIKLDTRGPVFFVQDRIGKNGNRFRLRKFRTMVVDAEARVAELRALSADPDWLLLEHDPRITRIGRFLRNTSLDELPQLWNVLRGEMSLVGPRPLIESEDRLIDGWGRSRLNLTPGLTGYWQVLGRTSIPFEEMVKLDYLYVANWSLWTDVRLMLRTVPAVLLRRGAN